MSVKKQVDEETGGIAGIRAVPLYSVKRDGFFKLRPTDESPVWVRGDYDRKEKKFHCYKYWDLATTHDWRGNKTVYVGFSF